MKVLYDLQAYTFGPHGGVVRIFDELFTRLPAHAEYEASLLQCPHAARPPPTGPRVAFDSWPPTMPPVCKYPFMGMAYRTLDRLHWNRSDVRIFHPTFYPASDRFARFKTVIGIYDLVHERLEAADDMPDRDAFLATKRRWIERADRLLCISEATRADLVDYYQVDPARTRVATLGCDPVFQPMDADHARRITRKVRPEGDRPFVFYVGGRQRYKNFHRFLHAYGHWKGRRDFDLVVVGRKPGWIERCLLDVAGNPPGVHFAGHLNDEELCALYSLAEFFVYPSLMEGFGIPLLEAMHAHCPLCLSDLPAFREVAGDTAVYFDPLDLDAMRDAFDASIGRRGDSLARAMERRAGQFSWQRCADETWKVYQELV